MMMKKETDRQAATLDGPRLLRLSPSSCMPQTTSQLTYSRFNIVMSVGMKLQAPVLGYPAHPHQTARPSAKPSLYDVSFESTPFDKADKTVM